MLVGTNIGKKLLNDAKIVVEERSVDSEMTTQLDDAFEILPTKCCDISDNTQLKKA